MVEWLAAYKLKIGRYLWLLLFCAKVRRKDEIAVGAKVYLFLYFELDGDLWGDLIGAADCIFGFVEDIFDQFEFEGVDLVEGRLILEDEEVLETTDDEVKITMAWLDYLLNLVSDLFEEFVDLTEVDVLQTEPTLRGTMDQLLHASDEFKVVDGALLVDAYLDALDFPLILLSKLLRGHKPNSNQELFLVILQVVCCDVLVD